MKQVNHALEAEMRRTIIIRSREPFTVEEMFERVKTLSTDQEMILRIINELCNEEKIVYKCLDEHLYGCPKYWKFVNNIH